MNALALLHYPQIAPIIFHVGPIGVHWYGVAYIVGFLLGYGLLRRMSRRGILRISRDALADLMAWLILAVIVGGRLGWWLFYHRTIYSDGHPVPEPWYEPVALWHGGMSFHGGLIGILLALILWTHWRGARGSRAAGPAGAAPRPLWNIADAIALAAPIGLFFGRIANFINGELFGRPTDVPWAMIFPTDRDGLPRHPSQLYEALLEGPLLLAALWLIRRLRRPADGQIAALFIILYGLLRFSVEFTRQPDTQLGYIAFGWLTMGQVLSLVMSLAGVGLWVMLRRGGNATIPRQSSR